MYLGLVGDVAESGFRNNGDGQTHGVVIDALGDIAQQRIDTWFSPVRKGTLRVNRPTDHAIDFGLSSRNGNHWENLRGRHSRASPRG